MPNYTTPPTAVAGQPLAAADFNAGVRDNFDLLHTPPQARIYNNANIATTSGVGITVPFNSERWDNYGMHDPVTNNSRLTVPAAQGGLWAAGANVQWSSTAGTYKVLVIQHTTADGVTTSNVGYQWSPPTALIVNVAAQWQAAAGDWFTVLAQHDGGAGIVLTFANPYTPEFWACKIG